MTWIWTGLGWGLTVLGAALLAWALFWDRAGWRGRAALRCQRCWYDLTGNSQAASASKVSPVVCPECGCGHRSRRAMRRTRRQWRWVSCAVVLFAGAHLARSAPGIQQRGWAAAVPSVVLVAWMPLMSDEPGSGLGRMSGFGPPAALPQPSKMDRLVLTEFASIGFSASGTTVRRPLGWVSRRLLFCLGRTQDVEVITDSTTAKGAAYKGVVTGVLRAEMAYPFERNWANGVAHVEAEADRAYGLGELVQGDFRIRRLVLGGYTLSGGFAGTLVEFRCSTPHSMWINGFVPNGTPQEMAAHWINRFRWDSVHIADEARGRTLFDLKHPLGMIDTTGTETAVRLHYAVMVNEARPSEPPRMARVAKVERSVPVQVDERRVIKPDTSAQTRAWLESKLAAELTVEYDSNRKAWIPLVRLRWIGNRDADITLLFGGMVSVDYVSHGAPNDQGSKLFDSGHDQTWWLVEPAQPWRRTWELEARPDRSSRFAGEVEKYNFLPSVRDRPEYHLVVHIKPMQGSTPKTYGGLWAERVYDGVLVLPLDSWTIEEIRRYIVNGLVPDHAMP